MMNPGRVESKKADILIVDDIPDNLNTLSRTLESFGYNVIAAPGGELALQIAAKTPPDLILLDIIMPGIDGYETCRRLKAEKSTAEIPVIFITAKDEVDSLVEGFLVGGVDYITKPFAENEVRVRVENHLKIHQLTQQLQKSNLTTGHIFRVPGTSVEKRNTPEFSNKARVARDGGRGRRSHTPSTLLGLRV